MWESFIIPLTNNITSAIRKFMLDVTSRRSFQNIGLLIWAQKDSDHVTMWFRFGKIEEAQLKVSLHCPASALNVDQKCFKELWWSDASLQSHCSVKFVKHATLLGTLRHSSSLKTHQIIMNLDHFSSTLDTLSECVNWFLIIFRFSHGDFWSQTWDGLESRFLVSYSCYNCAYAFEGDNSSCINVVRYSWRCVLHGKHYPWGTSWLYFETKVMKDSVKGALTELWKLFPWLTERPENVKL